MVIPEKSYLPAAGTEHACAAMAAPTVGLIAGLGNCLLRDDGIGVHAVRQLMVNPPVGTCVLEVGTDVFSAVPWLESAPWVLAIDAMEAGGKPGTLYQCASQDIQVEAIRTSLHELGLLSVLEFVPQNQWPDITILGIQPEVINYGLELSPALQEALPRVVAMARAIVAARPTAGASKTKRFARPSM